MDRHIVEIVLGPALEENVEEILQAGKSHGDAYCPSGDCGALLLQRSELGLDVLIIVQRPLHFRMPIAAVHLSVDNGTKREGVGDRVGISHVVQPPHLVKG